MAILESVTRSLLAALSSAYTAESRQQYERSVIGMLYLSAISYGATIDEMTEWLDGGESDG